MKSRHPHRYNRREKDVFKPTEAQVREKVREFLAAGGLIRPLPAEKAVGTHPVEPTYPPDYYRDGRLPAWYTAFVENV